MIKQCFLPLENQDIRLLILGSLPGDKSLQEQQYYAHPQNRFWKLMKLIFNVAEIHSYTDKLDLLLEHHIGLWDVCAQAQRKGSMDLDIIDEEPNDLDVFLADHPHIHTIIFNGQKAQKVFDKYFKKNPNYRYFTLPSTSPANAQYSLEKLLQEWRTVLKKD
ncbi:DNA-deoxyinosine glycosylase [Sphingobacterium sp. SRCM116780]|uniref:DNA-deoxyinosine glycosylase n=1 Tax=Sphingobacterium sp. SRCM116780 TaxID=2907623 RepID=UPI001F3CCC7C|nr:DNA-deoxyinosine glycosylase [Sphingobacterium sp. SRCM116780]UIR57207.1 DNA-deoxyinosine glycosylase [Sphingobacterium sp. SRCM116780]